MARGADGHLFASEECLQTFQGFRPCSRIVDCTFCQSVKAVNDPLAADASISSDCMALSGLKAHGSAR